MSKKTEKKKLGDGILLKTYGEEIEDKRIYEYSVPRKNGKVTLFFFWSRTNERKQKICKKQKLKIKNV